MHIAFDNFATLQAAAIAAVEAGDPAFTIAGTPDARIAAAARFGLTPALVLLMGAMGGRPEDAAARGFASSVLAGIRPGADDDAIVLGWMDWLYRGSSASLRTGLLDTPAGAAAEDVMALIAAARTRPVAAGTWRTALRALSGIPDLAPSVEVAASVVAAMAWGVEDHPGVAADAFQAWGDLVKAQADGSRGWDDSVATRRDDAHAILLRDSLATLGYAGLQDVPIDQRRLVLEAMGPEYARRMEAAGFKPLFDLAAERELLLHEAEGRRIVEARAGLLAAARQAPLG